MQKKQPHRIKEREKTEIFHIYSNKPPKLEGWKGRKEVGEGKEGEKAETLAV